MCFCVRVWSTGSSGDIAAGRGRVAQHGQVCLERDLSQIDVDVWRLIETESQMYALIVADIRGDPIEVTSCRLKALEAEGEVVLHPATYRLMFEESSTG